MADAERSFVPTPAAARAALAAVQPHAYARTRNALDGAVTGLSPYLTHGFLSLAEVAEAVLRRDDLDVQHKLIFELGWRAYYRHVWSHRGDGILTSLHEGVLPDSVYRRVLPADVARGVTGLPVIDQAVRTLHATGYLHNHARMWLASYLVHLRKVHWRVGADWMFSHLLDGDLASNHLSWQWIAGTGSHQPYLFNAANVARYAPADWHSPDTVIDTGYDELDQMARDAGAVAPAGSASDAAEAPALHASPPRVIGQTGAGAALAVTGTVTDPDAAVVTGRAVWLAHPWALSDAPPDHTVVAWLPRPFFSAWPWSARRWDFVLTRLATLTPHVWLSDRETLAAALAGAVSVRTRHDPHVAPWLPAIVRVEPERALFPTIETRCDSFSRWWRLATRGCHRAQDLLEPTLL